MRSDSNEAEAVASCFLRHQAISRRDIDYEKWENNGMSWT